METEFDPNVEVVTGLATLKTEELVPVTNKPNNKILFKESLTNLLSIPVDKDAMQEMLPNCEAPENPNMGDYLAGAMIMKAALGDTKAYEVIRDTIGQKPVERVEQDTVMRVVMDQTVQEYGE